MVVLLYEDDCAPDARESFDKKMKKITGMTSSEFKLVSTLKTYDGGLTEHWIYREFILAYSGDDPYYVLYKQNPLRIKEINNE